MISKELKAYFKDICKIYGCKLIFESGEIGGYREGKLFIGVDTTDKDCIDIFCHELGHFKNDVENKFPVYHHELEADVIKKWGLRKYASYALRAEIYTEKI